jgi:nucleotide-binding universal stress UspA family protein
MKQILCVVDFSEATEKVLEEAANLANASKAHMIVLFPYRLLSQGHGDDMVALKTTLESEAKKKFQNMKNTLQSLEKASCEFQPEIGFAAGRISAYLAKKYVDMVIIGEQQLNEGNYKNGSDLQNMISTSRVPFVVVRPRVNAKTSV